VGVNTVGTVTHDTPLFWSEWGRRNLGKTRAPMEGKNIWRLCKTHGRLIGYPMLKPHDLRHGVAMEILEAQHDLEAVRAMLGHVRLETTQIYAQIHRRSSSARWSSTRRRRSTRSVGETNGRGTVACLSRVHLEGVTRTAAAGLSRVSLRVSVASPTAVVASCLSLVRHRPQTRSVKHQQKQFGGPNGIRTRVSALRGPCPGPLDDGASLAERA
jgi:Phage integrase family